MSPPFFHPFVNRQAELDLLAQRINLLSQGRVVKDCVVNICGISGTGKTALLAALAERWSGDPTVTTISIDVSLDHAQPDLRMAKIRLLQAFRTYPFLVASAASPIDTSSDAAIDTEMAWLVSRLGNHATALVLILDAWQHAPDGLDAWVECTLLLPLIRHERVVCLLGSQKPFPLRQFEVRRRIKRLQLDALDLAATRQMACADAEIGLTVYGITFGHPATTMFILDQLAAHKQSLAWLRANRAVLTEAAIDALYARIPQPIEPPLRQIVYRLAALRRFDIMLLQATLLQPGAEYRLTQTTLRRYLVLLGEAALVYWQREKNAYQIDNAVRQMLAQILHSTDPDQFIVLHAATADYYKQLLRYESPQWTEYLIEYCYHLLYKQHAQPHTTKAIKTAFQAIIRQHGLSTGSLTLDVDMLGYLRNAMQEDIELQALLAEHDLTPARLLDTIASLAPSEPLLTEDTIKRALAPPDDP